MTIRMKDIARDLGLSVVTVSKVLRDHPDIGEETRKRVLQRVKELDYEPNILARSLVTGRSYLIGLIVPGLIHPFFAEVARALSKAIVDKGYSLIVSSSEEDPALEAREIRHLLARRLDALVIASSGADTQLFRRMRSQSQPFVLIDRAFDDLEADFVGIDDRAGGISRTSVAARTAPGSAAKRVIWRPCARTSCRCGTTTFSAAITWTRIASARDRRRCGSSCKGLHDRTPSSATTTPLPSAP
jgi:ABC-type sugar transport system substrate-binding protein